MKFDAFGTKYFDAFYAIKPKISGRWHRARAPVSFYTASKYLNTSVNHITAAAYSNAGAVCKTGVHKIKTQVQIVTLAFRYRTPEKVIAPAKRKRQTPVEVSTTASFYANASVRIHTGVFLIKMSVKDIAPVRAMANSGVTV